MVFGLLPDLKKEYATTQLLKKLSEAAEAVSSIKTHVWEGIKRTYVDRFSDANPDNFPEDLQVFYDSVKLRITSVEPSRHIGNDKAGCIAGDMLSLADVISSGWRKL